MKLFIDHSIVNAEKFSNCKDIKKKICVADEDQLFRLMTKFVEECYRAKAEDIPLVVSFSYRIGEYVVSTVSYMNGNIVTLIRKNLIKDETVDMLIDQAVKELLVIFSMKTEYVEMLFEKYKNDSHDRIRSMHIKQCAECGVVYKSRGNDRICKTCYSNREKISRSEINKVCYKKLKWILAEAVQSQNEYSSKVYEDENINQQLDEIERFIESLENKLFEIKQHYGSYNTSPHIILLDKAFNTLLLTCFSLKKIIIPEIIVIYGERIASFILGLKEIVDSAFGTNIKELDEEAIDLYIEMTKIIIDNVVIFDDVSKINVSGAIAASIKREKISDAVRIIAAFDVDVSAEITRIDTKKWLEVDETLEEIIIDRIISDIDHFDEYYSIIEENPTSLQLFKILMFSARWTRRYTNILNIYSKLNVLDDKRNIKLSIHITLNKLNCLVDIADVYEIEKVTLQLIEWISNAEQLGLDQEDKMLCCNGLLNAYLTRKCYLDAIKFSYSLEHEYCNEKTFYFLSKTYFYLEKYNEAERYCLGAIQYMDNVASAYFLLGQIYLKMERYNEAITSLNKTISLINYYYMQRKYILIAENGHISTCWSVDGKEKELEQVYMYLIQAYMGVEDYNKAHAAYDIFLEEVHVVDSTITSGMMLSINEKLNGKEKEIRSSYNELLNVHKSKMDQFSRLSETLNAISKKLISSQIFDESLIISDEYWEKNIREKIYGVIEDLEEQANLKSEKRYKEIYDKIMIKFPNMISESVNYLASAEQMYILFKENNLVDYAPVMVEYCKVVDSLLWNYLRKSKEYKYEVQNNADKGKEETLGSAVYIIGCKSARAKTLHKYYEELEKIKDYRNASAHVNVSRKPEVEWVKKYLMEKSDLIEVLIQ